MTFTQGFHTTAKNQVDVLVEMHKNMNTMFKELVEYFCMDVKKTPLDEFFGDLKNFLDQYEVGMLHKYPEKEDTLKINAIIFLFGGVPGRTHQLVTRLGSLTFAPRRRGRFARCEFVACNLLYDTLTT